MINNFLHNILLRIKKSHFTKSVLLIAGGTASAQIISILITPLITRIYLPQEFGVFSLFMASLGLLSPVASLKYEWAIPIAEDNDETSNVLFLSFLVLIFCTVLISVALLLQGKVIMGYFNAQPLWHYSFYIPVGVLGVGLYNIFLQWSFRSKNYKGISKTKFYQALSQGLLKIGIGLLGFKPHGLIIGNIIGQSAGISSLGYPIFVNKGMFSKISLQNIVAVAKRYANFPLFSATSQFFNSAGIQLPTVFMAAIYGTKMVGYFGLANSIVSIPMLLIGTSIGDVFYGEAASIGRKNPFKLKTLSNSLFKKLFIIGLFPLIGFLIFGPLVFSIVFGKNWYQAGIYAQCLSLLVFVRLIFTPVSRIYSIFERQKEAFLIDLFRFIVVCLVFYLARKFDVKPIFTIISYTVGMSLVYLITFVVARHIINFEISKSKSLIAV